MLLVEVPFPIPGAGLAQGKAWRCGDLAILYSLDRVKEFPRPLKHLSISHRVRTPTAEEIHEIKQQLLHDLPVRMVTGMLNSRVIHLWEIP